ncbi:MAG: NAD-dependent epimerase/dehydratase family protein [Planctomycetia bacterium]
MLAPRQFSVTDDFLVTGATGLVGNNVGRQLVSRGQSVRVLVRGRGETVERAFAGLPVERRFGDLDDAAGLEAAADGAAVVVHAAALVHCGWRHLDEMRAVNVEGTRRVARAARLAGARLIHVSSVDAIGLRPDGLPADEETPPGGMPECPYVVTKREAEAAVLDEVGRGLDAVIVNPVFMVGPWDWKPSSGRMLLEIGAGKGLFAPPGGNDFVDVRDVAAGILAAIERGRTGRRYILGGHRGHAQRLHPARDAGEDPPGVEVREGVAAVRVAGWLGDTVSLFTSRERPVNSAATAMSMLAHNFSSRRAEAELGYTFRPFDATVQDAWEWFVDRGYARAVRARTALAR